MRSTKNAWLCLAYGGSAKGIPRNWETWPEVIPVKVP